MGNILKFWATFYFNICSHWQVLTKLAFWWKTHSFLFHYYSRWNFTLIRHNNINPNHAMSLLPSAMKQSKLVKRYLNRDWIYLHNLIQFLMDQSRPLFYFFCLFNRKEMFKINCIRTADAGVGSNRSANRTTITANLSTLNEASIS